MCGNIVDRYTRRRIEKNIIIYAYGTFFNWKQNGFYWRSALWIFPYKKSLMISIRDPIDNATRLLNGGDGLISLVEDGKIGWEKYWSIPLEQTSNNNVFFVPVHPKIDSIARSMSTKPSPLRYRWRNHADLIDGSSRSLMNNRLDR